jgi:TolB-like protein/DNA-binding winged helix-turn-helix (wHTH) protein
MKMADPDDRFLFEGFRLDRRAGGLFQRDANGVFAPVPIGARALDVLDLLVARAGELVTRDEITAAVWPESVVEDNNLNMQIAAVRRVLDSGRPAPSCIQTIPRRGYRFVVPVVRECSEAPAAAAATPLEVVRVGEAHEAERAATANRRPHSRVRRHRLMAGLVGVLALLALAATAAVWTAYFRWPIGPAQSPRLSIVVLPFANLGGDPGQQYFADAITEDLTTDLSRLADMLVISRGTAFTYKDKLVSAKRIGQELGVRYMLEGGVQRSGKQVRVNAQLIDTDTDTHIWAERFDSSIGDLLALQNEITERIAITLNLKLIASEAARPNEHPDALDHIFRGRAAIYRPASRQTFAVAIAEFDEALALDPTSVEAEGRLAAALASRVLDDMTDAPARDLERASHLIEQALAKAPESPVAHFAKGQLLRAQHHCHTAIAEYQSVLAADRNAVASIGNIGRCKIYLGLMDDGVALEEQAIRLSPHDPFLGIWYFRIGQARLLQGRVDEAIQWLEKARDRNSAYQFVPAWLAAAYGLKGDLSRAAGEVTEARRLSGNGSPASIAAERTSSAMDFTAPANRALLEKTYLAGLRDAGVPDE